MYNASLITPLNYNIVVFNNCMTHPEKIPGFINILDNIEDSYKMLTKFKPWYANNNGIIDENICYGLEKTATKNNKINNELIERKCSYVIDSIYTGIEFCSALYENGLRLNKINWPSTFTIRKWNKGYGMGPHADLFTTTKKDAVSALVYINDDYLGGELNFPEYNIKVKPKAGSIIMFPSNVVHEALPVLEGEKYFATFFSN